MPDEKARRVLADLKSAVEPLELPLLVIGANARIHIFDLPQKVNGRATTDWDVAIKIESWNVYDNLRDRLIGLSQPRFRATSMYHRFTHIQTHIEVDIVPFGALSAPDKTIEWQDGHQMTVIGFEEALNNAERHSVEGVKLQVINVPTFLALKLFSWSDRRAEKDLDDVDFILRNHADDDRVFKELSLELAEEQIEFDEAAILLLGRDIKRMFYTESVDLLENILADILQSRDRIVASLVSRSLQSEDWDAEFDQTVRRFLILRNEIQDYSIY